jgi:hypothetical protein
MPRLTPGSKHIGIHYHCFQSKIEKGFPSNVLIVVMYCQSIELDAFHVTLAGILDSK